MPNVFSDALKKVEDALSTSGLTIVGTRNMGMEQDYSATTKSESKKAVWIDVTISIPLNE